MAEQENPLAVERYVPVGELEDWQAAELAVVGLSVHFPEAIRRLNTSVLEGFGTNNARSFAGFRFSLMPDPERPRVDVEEDRSFPYDINVHSDIFHNATFTVKSALPFGERSINWVELPALHAFVGEYPGEHLFRLQARPQFPDLQEDIPVLDVPLEALVDDTSLEDAGFVKDEHVVRLSFTEDAHTSLHLPLVYTAHAGRNPKAFGVSNVLAKDTAANIEAIMGAYSELVRFDLPPE